MNKLKRLEALFMAFLVISLPIIASKALASSGSIEEFRYVNKQGLEGKMSSSSDYLNVTVKVEVEEMEMTGDNLHIDFDGDDTFDECEASGAQFLCRYKSEEKDRNPDKVVFHVKLMDEFFMVLDQKTGEVIIDGEAPVVQTFNIPANVVENVTIHYKVVDTAYPGSSSCSGLEKIEIYSNDALAVELNASGCVSEGDLEYNIAILDLHEGVNKVCMKAYDIVGLESAEVCRDVSVDYTSPVVVDASFKMLNTHGDLIYYSGPSAVQAKILINITDDVSGLDGASVVANFSDLNTIIPSQYYAIKPSSCPKTGENVWTCQWDSVFIESIDGAATITINASDMSGNEVKFTKQLNIPKDDTLPVVILITSHNGDFINRNNNTFIVQLDEYESGFYKQQVSLNMQDIKGGIDVPAENCTVFEGLWTCFWYQKFAGGHESGDMATIKIASAKDDVGNELDPSLSEMSHDFLYDDTAPEFINITIVPMGVERDVLIDKPEEVAFIMTYFWENHSGVEPEKVFANFKAFDPTAIEELVPAESCEQLGDYTWRCFWQYSGTLMAGKHVKLNIIAVDNAGNKKDSKIDNVYGEIDVVETTEEPYIDWWQAYATTNDGMPFYELNKNFLWMSSLGTEQRIKLELLEQPNSYPNKYVHSFYVTKCLGTFSDKSYVPGASVLPGVPGTGPGFPPTGPPTGFAITGHAGEEPPNDNQGDETPPPTEPPGEAPPGSPPPGLPPGVPPTAPGVEPPPVSDFMFEEWAITGQYYYPNTLKSKKYITVNIPPTNKSTLAKVDRVIILCEAEITQSKGPKGDIIVPNEGVNISVEIPLRTGLFTEPDASSVNEIYEHENEIEILDNILEFTGFFVEWIQPVCSLMSAIIGLVNSIGVIFDALALIPPGTMVVAKNAMDKASNGLDVFWRGTTDTTYDMKIGSVVLNEKKWYSVGFICDLVLCSSCGKMWGQMTHLDDLNNLLRNKMSEGKLNEYWMYEEKYPDADSALGGETEDQHRPLAEREMGAGDFIPSASLSPHSSLLIALICVPPCIPTIHNKLLILRQLYMTYNVCLNEAYLRAEHDPTECDEYMEAKWCEFGVGEVWYIVYGFIKAFFVNAIVYLIEQALAYELACPKAVDAKSPTCKPFRIIDIVYTGTALIDVRDQWFAIQNNKLIRQMSVGGDHDDHQDEEDGYKDKADEECKKYGCGPKY